MFQFRSKEKPEIVKKYNAKAVFVDKNNKVYVSDGVEFTLTAKNYKILNLSSFRTTVDFEYMILKNGSPAITRENY